MFANSLGGPTVCGRGRNGRTFLKSHGPRAVSYPFEAYICNYILLLDCLINSEEDVELLVDKRIIVNLLGSSEAVARMVNNLCLEIIETKSCYRHIADDLNKLYDSPWNQNISLRNVHFWDVWRGTASVVGVLVLVITIFNFPRPFVFKNT